MSPLFLDPRADSASNNHGNLTKTLPGMEWDGPILIGWKEPYKDAVQRFEGMEIGAVSLESWRAAVATVRVQSAFRHEQGFADRMAKHLAGRLLSPVDAE